MARHVLDLDVVRVNLVSAGPLGTPTLEATPA